MWRSCLDSAVLGIRCDNIFLYFMFFAYICKSIFGLWNNSQIKDMIQDINEYKRFVHQLRMNNDVRIFLNSDTDHAIVVLSEIFSQSQDTIRIFASNLCRTVGSSPSYIASLSEFIERGGKVRILLNDYKEELAKDSNLYKRLAYHKSLGKDVIIKTTTAKPYRTSDASKKEVHFTVGDEKSYRMETDIESRTAECSMNNPEVASMLVTFFDNLFANQENNEVDILKLFGYDK